MQPEQPPDPYQSVWQMSQVGAGGKRRFRDLKLVSGLIAGILMFLPFGLITSIVWGWWGDADANVNGVGWAFALVGLAAGMVVGGIVASSDS
jgi:hypothetical protein